MVLPGIGEVVASGPCELLDFINPCFGIHRRRFLWDVG